MLSWTVILRLAYRDWELWNRRDSAQSTHWLSEESVLTSSTCIKIMIGVCWVSREEWIYSVNNREGEGGRRGRGERDWDWLTLYFSLLSHDHKAQMRVWVVHYRWKRPSVVPAPVWHMAPPSDRGGMFSDYCPPQPKPSSCGSCRHDHIWGRPTALWTLLTQLHPDPIREDAPWYQKPHLLYNI